MNYEHFGLSPANGAIDPLPSYTGSLGGLTNFKYLTAEPWTIKLNLNEWVRAKTCASSFLREKPAWYCLMRNHF